MTPTTNEREARELLAREYERDGQDFVARCLRYEPDVTTLERRSIRAIIAALTREQREGECPVCGLAWGEHRLGYAASSCKAKPQQEAPGAVACWRLVSRFGVCSVWLTGDISADAARQAIADGNRVERAYTTPPAPVDVRLRSILEHFDTAFASACLLNGSENELAIVAGKFIGQMRALLDGQPAGVDDAMVERACHACYGADWLCDGDEGHNRIVNDETRAHMRGVLQAALGGEQQEVDRG